MWRTDGAITSTTQRHTPEKLYVCGGGGGRGHGKQVSKECNPWVRSCCQGRASIHARAHTRKPRTNAVGQANPCSRKGAVTCCQTVNRLMQGTHP